MPSPQKKYTTLVSNTLLFAISNFSSKLLSFFIRPYLSYALDSPDVMGVSSLLQQATNLLIPVVSLGVAYAVIRFGLDKATNKSSVLVNGAATIGLGFVVLLLAMPLVRLIPNAAEYLGFLYLCVLASCMRTLCTQFIRSRMLNRLVAIDGVLTTLSLLLYYLLFLSVLKMGAAGFLLANALADLTSMVFVFIAGGCWRYFKPKAFDKALWKEMLRYCLPMIPASISFWIINASDMFFVQGMCEGLRGPQRQPLGRPAVGGVLPAADHHDFGQHLLRGVAALRRDRGDGPRGVLLQDIPRVCQRAVLLRGGHHHAVPAAHAGVQG